MIEKKRSSKTSKLKNFLVTGSIEDEEDQSSSEDNMTFEEPTEARECVEEIIEEEIIIEDIIISIDDAGVPAEDPERINGRSGDIIETDLSSLEKKIVELKEMVASLTSELGRHTTSKEQLKEYSSVINRRDAELSDRKFIGMLEQLSVMREDFFKLCKGMDAKLDSFSPKDILNSFEAYVVDMENILVDCGVKIGQSQFERLNTIHQRIVDVIPTDDESKNGMVAERLSDGYEYHGRVLLKEKVKIYKFSENLKTEGDEEI